MSKARERVLFWVYQAELDLCIPRRSLGTKCVHGYSDELTLFIIAWTLSMHR